MDKVKPIYDDQIDLFSNIEIILKNKWKLIGFVFFCLFFTYGYLSIQMPSSFIATTKLMPISTTESNKYLELNDNGFIEINPMTLMNLYVELFEERKYLEDSIKKHKLIDIEKYNYKDDYNLAIKKFAQSVLLSVKNPTSKEIQDNKIKYQWTITAQYNDMEKWGKTILSVNNLINQAMQNVIQDRFNKLIDIQDKNLKFEIEDIKNEIKNVHFYHNKKIANELKYLKEQAAIARALKIENDSIDLQGYQTSEVLIANVGIAKPFYFRGYKSIEKEIELIESREEGEEAFMDNLAELEIRLRNIEQNKIIERANLVFSDTPIANDSSFIGFRVMITDYKYPNKLYLYIIAIVMSGIIGSIFIIYSTAYLKRKDY